jgi:hypothetical protein
MRAPLVLTLVTLASVLPASVMLVQPSPDDAYEAASWTQPLPKIAPAPGFTLTSQDDAQISLADLSGKVVAGDLHLHPLHRDLPGADASDVAGAGSAWA